MYAAYIIIKSLNFYLKKLHGGIRLLVLKTDGSIVLTEVLNMSVSRISKRIMRLSIVVFASYVGLGSRVLLCYSLLDDFGDDALCD
jgi:hypothetical protein